MIDDWNDLNEVYARKNVQNVYGKTSQRYLWNQVMCEDCVEEVKEVVWVNLEEDDILLRDWQHRLKDWREEKEERRGLTTLQREMNRDQGHEM